MTVVPSYFFKIYFARKLRNGKKGKMGRRVEKWEKVSFFSFLFFIALNIDSIFIFQTKF